MAYACHRENFLHENVPHTTCSCGLRLENALMYDSARADVEKHPDPLVRPSLIKVCAFFYYRQVHLQTTIHHTSALSLQARNELSQSDLWL